MCLNGRNGAGDLTWIALHRKKSGKGTICPLRENRNLNPPNFQDYISKLSKRFVKKLVAHCLKYLCNRNHITFVLRSDCFFKYKRMKICSETEGGTICCEGG